MICGVYVRNISYRILDAEYCTPKHFSSCQWFTRGGKTDLVYLCYRWLLAAIFTILLAIGFFDDQEHYGKFFIYLTHWGFILCTLQAIASAVIVTKYIFDDSFCESNKVSTLCRIYWIMYSMAVVTSIGITVIFWVKVYDPNYHTLGPITFVMHGLNSVLMILDVLIVSHPLKFTHILWTFCFVFIYFTFSFVYYIAGGTNNKNHGFIYEALDWRHPDKALTFCVIGFAFGFVVHILTWTLSAIVRTISGVAFEDYPMEKRKTNKYIVNEPSITI